MASLVSRKPKPKDDPGAHSSTNAANLGKANASPTSATNAGNATGGGSGDPAGKDSEDEDSEPQPSFLKDPRAATQKKLIGFFGNRPTATQAAQNNPNNPNNPNKTNTTPPLSWRNLFVTVFTFVTFFFVLCLQIWIICKSVGAGHKTNQNPSKPPSYTSAYPQDTFSQARLTQTEFKQKKNKTSSSGRMTISASKTKSGHSDSASKRSLQLIAASTAVIELDIPTPVLTTPAAIMVPPAPTFERLEKRRKDRNKPPARDLSISCLYYNGTELSKKGGFALGFNVLYNLWIIFFIVVLLTYERKRLRINRHAHSAAVVGLVQAWLGVDYLAKGVEGQIVAAAVMIFFVAFCNLWYGLPETHTNRQNLFSFMLSRQDEYSVPSAGKSYAIPPKPGQQFPTAEEVVAVLNKGIEEEGRMLGRPVERILKDKITKYNAPRVDSIPPQYLNPAGLSHLGPDEKAKLGEVGRDIERYVIGGIMPFEAIGQGANMAEMMRTMMLNSAKGGGKGGGAADMTQQLMNLQLMENMMNKQRQAPEAVPAVTQVIPGIPMQTYMPPSMPPPAHIPRYPY